MNRAIWFFGLSGAGKTTLAYEIDRVLKKRNLNTTILDGDIVRKGLNKDLGFTKNDRNENIRRVAEVCKLMLEAGIIPIVAAITPYNAQRRLIREIIKNEKLVLVHVKCSIEVCEARDPKQLYHLARKGLIKNFTGVSDVFEENEKNCVVIDTTEAQVIDSVASFFEQTDF